MTKEELEKEAEATIMLFFGGVIPDCFTLDEVVMLMTKFATEATKELEAQIERMKCCSNCNHFNKESDIEYCQNCERQLVNSLDNFPREEIIKDEWELRR